MSSRTAVLMVTTIVVAGLLVIGCAASFGGPSSCDGIDAQLGGCDPNRPSFVGHTCEAVGDETGKQLNDRLLAVYRGPDVDGGESRAVRANHVMTVTTSLANAHLRAIGIIKECGVDEFAAAVEAQFSPEFKSSAGVYLFDGPPATYED